MNAFSPDLITWKPDEVTRGAIPFDTDRYLKGFDDKDEIERYVQEHPDSRLLTLERDVPSLPDSVGDRLRLIRQWFFSMHRVYGLYDFGAQKSVPATAEP
jgi:hypothetical protein